MKKEYIIISVLILIILIGVIYFGYEKVNESCNIKIYNASLNSYNQGQVDLIIKINNDGLIPVLNNQSVKFVDLNEICGK